MSKYIYEIMTTNAEKALEETDKIKQAHQIGDDVLVYTRIIDTNVFSEMISALTQSYNQDPFP